MDNKKMLYDLKSILLSNFPGIIQKIILFGSRITGDSSDDSDVDILIITTCKIDWNLERRIINACYSIDLEYDMVTDVKIVSSDELREKKGCQPYIRDAIDNGVTA
jgi:predicted nucleotidyltransferase